MKVQRTRTTKAILKNNNKAGGLKGCGVNWLSLTQPN